MRQTTSILKTSLTSSIKKKAPARMITGAFSHRGTENVKSHIMTGRITIGKEHVFMV